MDLETDHLSEQEAARTADVLRLMPRGRKTALEIGPRDGHFSRLLTGYFETVTALDLVARQIPFDRVTMVTGDVTKLPFLDNSFDCIVCTQVLEHIHDVETACAEISRVTRYEVIIGVPYRQDTRVGRTTCAHCGGISPPWGHVNTFDELRLQELFPRLKPLMRSFVWQTRNRTNALSARLMDLAGNPWGVYGEEWPCIHCGGRQTVHVSQNPAQRAFSFLAMSLTRLQSPFVRPRPAWIHMVFSKLQDGSPIL